MQHTIAIEKETNLLFADVYYQFGTEAFSILKLGMSAVQMQGL